MSNPLIVNSPIQAPAGIRSGDKKNNLNTTNTTNTKNSFQEVLAQKLQEKKDIKFSKHAQSRLMSREINVSDLDLQQLKAGINKAEKKGAKDSLIMVNKVAYVVSVDNKTVITAVDESNMQERIFTNIDSAVFMA